MRERQKIEEMMLSEERELTEGEQMLKVQILAAEKEKL